MHFNSAGENVPVFDVCGATLYHKDSFRYLGMVFYSTLNMAKSAEHAARPFLASAYRIRRFVRELTIVRELTRFGKQATHFFVAR